MRTRGKLVIDQESPRRVNSAGRDNSQRVDRKATSHCVDRLDNAAEHDPSISYSIGTPGSKAIR